MLSQNVLDYKQYITSIIDSLDVRDNGVRLAIVTYSNNPQILHYFRDLQTKNNLKNVVNGIITTPGNQLRMNTALGFAQQLLVLNSLGARDTVRKVVLVFATAAPSDALSLITRNADSIKAIPASIVVVGISTQVNDNTLQTVASSKDHYVKVPTFADLPLYLTPVLSPLCPPNTVGSTEGFTTKPVFTIDPLPGRFTLYI